MARKPRDRQREGSLSRLNTVIDNPAFRKWLEDIRQRIEEAGPPKPTAKYGRTLVEQVAVWRFSESIEPRIPGRCGRFLYHGIYYDLRDLCDRYHLAWPIDAEFLLRGLLADNEQRLKDAIARDDCPPARDWQFFRMAKTGLGLLRPDELERAKAITDAGRKRKLESGLPDTELAEWYDVTERTVQNAIKSCWNYCERRGTNSEIAEEAGLTPDEYMALLLKLRFREMGLRDRGVKPLDIPINYFDEKGEK